MKRLFLIDHFSIFNQYLLINGQTKFIGHQHYKYYQKVHILCFFIEFVKLDLRVLFYKKIYKNSKYPSM